MSTDTTHQPSQLQPGYAYAITSLSLAVLCALFLGFLFSIAGIVFGVLSLKTEGRGIGIAGIILCSIMTVIRVVQTLHIHGII
jgi:hypothetical protein